MMNLIESLYLCRVFYPSRQQGKWRGTRYIIERRLLDVLSSTLQTSQLCIVQEDRATVGAYVFV